MLETGDAMVNEQSESNMFDRGKRGPTPSTFTFENFTLIIPLFRP